MPASLANANYKLIPLCCGALDERRNADSYHGYLRRHVWVRLRPRFLEL